MDVDLGKKLIRAVSVVVPPGVASRQARGHVFDSHDRGRFYLRWVRVVGDCNGGLGMPGLTLGSSRWWFDSSGNDVLLPEEVLFAASSMSFSILVTDRLDWDARFTVTFDGLYFEHPDDRALRRLAEKAKKKP